MRATLKYVPLNKPRVQRYAIDVSKDGKTTRFVVSPDGKSASATAIPAEKKAAKPEKEFDVPVKATRAVAALKALYPDLAVLKITHEVFDDGTGDLEILTYEVEFVTGGIEREMVASPEGVIPHLWAPVATKNLPKAVTDALGKAASGSKIDKARAFEKGIDRQIWCHQRMLLKVGAAGRLLIAGEIKEVLPLDNAELLEQAGPIISEGEIIFDPVKFAASEDGIVKAVTAKRGLALIVLGGDHDLSDSIRRVGSGRCEYIRVTTGRYKYFADE
jgi:hypothetical protein